MEKKLSDYLPYYIGQKVQVDVFNKLIIGVLVGFNPEQYFIHFPGNATWIGRFQKEFTSFKLILRPLSSITKEEAKQLILQIPFYTRHQINIEYIDPNPYNGIIYEVQYNDRGRFWSKSQSLTKAFTPEQFQYMLSKGFDIFNLKEAGLAIYEE